MKKLFTPFSVGLVVLVALAASIWMFGAVREGIGDDPSGYRVWAFFRDASGLTAKTRVVVAGITVGQIDNIELAGDQAKVWMLVNTPLTDQTHIAKRSASLLGEYFIQLSPGALGEPLKDGDQITLVDYDADTSDLLNEAKVIVENVRDVTASLKRIVGERQGEDKIVEILDKLNNTVSELQRVIGENGHKVDRIINNVEKVSADARVMAADAKAFVKDFKGSAKGIMKDAEKVASNARVIVENVRDAVGDTGGASKPGDDSEEGSGDGVKVASGGAGDGGKGAVGRLQSALNHLDNTLAHTNSIVQKIDEGDGSIGRLVNDGHLIDTVTELVDEGKDYISGLLRLQTIVAIRSEYYMQSKNSKNYVSLMLQPRPDKYYLLQLVDDPRGNTKFRETITRTTDSTEDPVVHTQETITEDTFRFSLEFAKRIYMFTGRVGIIESTGGVGLDVHLLGDDLQISTDLFGFAENVNPHLKFWATYNFFTYLYLAAGIDELLNKDYTDWFIGGGIQFNDRDLKALLGSVPSP